MTSTGWNSDRIGGVRRAGDTPFVPAPTVIWAFGFHEGHGHELDPATIGAPALDDENGPEDGAFVWMHLHLADHATIDWIERGAGLDDGLREMLLSTDEYQRAVVGEDWVGIVVHDLKREYQLKHTDEIGALHIAIGPRGIVTARKYPLGCGDIVRRRLLAGTRVASTGDALAVVVGAIVENLEQRLTQMSIEAQAVEDAVLAENARPGDGRLLKLRRSHAQLHRIVDGMHKVFLRLERDHDLPEALEEVTKNLAQRVLGLDSDLRALHGQLLLLRDEMEALGNQRINQNLYLLSVMTALMMPATLITGYFGMNTGDLPLIGHGGSLFSSLAVGGSSLAAYLFLRARGFFR
ncbi:MAG TPA: CorA family divalent cation transporter [Novosphingobium sp.]|nr:CorA family divalent cation transporter [Novosphingobium sp.]